MKIALCSTSVPFVNGGYRNIVDWLATALKAEGHAVETIYLPENDDPDLLLPQMMAFRSIDLSMADMVICFRPQAHLISHPNKVIWFIHHIRPLYDLWDTEYRGMEQSERTIGLRDTIRSIDTAALAEASKLFANSTVTAQRLLKFNGLESRVLYPPVNEPERFRFVEQNDEILCICRMEHHKRQHLLIDAMSRTRSAVRLRLCGVGSSAAYPESLEKQVAELGIGDRVTIDHRWIGEEDKQELLGRCLAMAYLPFDEDSYGYPTLEAALSSKPILTTSDAGGVLEFVEHEASGLICEPEPEALAAAMDRLFEDRAGAKRMGKGALGRISDLAINWPSTIAALLS